MNKKIFLLATSGLSTALFLVTLIMSYNRALTSSGNWVPFFTTSAIIVLLPLIGHAFPFLRKKEQSLKTYMLPASMFEKFTFEFILKLILIPATFLLLFPLISNLAVSFADFIYHANPNNTSRTFTHFSYEMISYIFKRNIEIKYVMFFLVALNAIIAFTGSAVFRKYPLIKTVLFIGGLTLSVIGYFYFMLEKLKLNRGIEYTIKHLFNDDTTALYCLKFFIIFTILTCLPYAYFKLKEREV